MLTAVSGLLALRAGGLAAHPLQELAVLLVYGMLVSAFALFLKKICPTPQLLCCLIPFFIVGSLVFCPVFVDAGRFFPQIDVVGRLFLPYYYLRWVG